MAVVKICVKKIEKFEMPGLKLEKNYLEPKYPKNIAYCHRDVPRPRSNFFTIIPDPKQFENTSPREFVVQP